MAKKPYNLILGVILRGVRGFVAGFLAVAVSISLSNITTWGELGTALTNLALAGVVGGITGAILAFDKAVRG
jgi:hypothetical protein